jgi:DNA mismatch repair protein MutL
MNRNMPRIQQLSTNVVNKIAAGEVIERPASVVKELLENSLDAGARRVDIELEQGGTELIRIVDDGHGIEPDDLPLVFASHATSKLKSADDLFQIVTMGFRGEAMASIGGIAKVTVQSRAEGHETGAEIFCDGGDLSEVRPWNGSPGTRIEVRHLFFNTPVRKKFLRTIQTELGHVTDIVERIALARPSLHVVLKHNGKPIYEVPASMGLRDRIGLFFGKEIRDSLIELNAGTPPNLATGFIADPKVDRGNNKLQYIFLNGRFIRDRTLGHAFQEAYRGLLMTGRYAVGFLFLRIPPDAVDVNVHPTKAEVRFRDSQAMYHLVRGGVKQRLLANDLMPMLQVPADQQVDEAEPDRVAKEEPEEPSLFNEPEPTPPPIPERTIAPRVVVAPPEALPHGPGELRPMPVPQPAVPILTPAPAYPKAIQIHDSYLVVETFSGMLVIDQHALHERILFEQLRQRIRDGKLEAQRLLIPEPIDLTTDQAASVIEAKPQLLDLGIDVEDFGGGTIALSSYPALLGRIPPGEIFLGVVDALTTKDRPPTRDQLFNHLMATMACKAAVKAGDKLSADEIDYLMQLREMAEDSHHCPHGRPTSLNFSRKELDKQFKRL